MSPPLNKVVSAGHFGPEFDVLIEIYINPGKYVGTERFTIYQISKHILRSISRARAVATPPAPPQNEYIVAACSRGHSRLRAHSGIAEIVQAWKVAHCRDYGDNIDQFDDDLERLSVGLVSFPDFRNCGYVGGRYSRLNVHDVPEELLVRIANLARHLDCSSSALWQLALLDVLREQPGVPALYAEAMEAVLAEFCHTVERRARYAREILDREET